MAIIFNPFTSNFDYIGGSATTWLAPVQSISDLPSGDVDGAARVVLDEDTVYVYDNSTDTWHNSRLTETEYSAISDPDGVTLDSDTVVGTPNIENYKIVLHAADENNPGAMSTTAQTFAGDKTFNDDVIVQGDLTVNGTTTTINTATLDVEDANITINKNGTQATANTNNAGLTIEMSDATDVVFGYDSTLASRMKLGDLADEREVMTVSHIQTVTNKDMGDDSNILTNASSNAFTRETGNQQIISIPDSAIPDNFVLEDFTQTLTNKTLDNSNIVTLQDDQFTLQDDGDNTKQAQFELANITTATTRTYSLPDGNTELLGDDTVQTISNKTIDNTNTITVEDVNLTIQDDGDNTKQARFNVSQITTATTRTYDLPDGNTELLGDDTTQTVSNKTLDNTNIITIQDDNLTLQDNSDNTKQAQFQLSNITTGTTRIYTLPDANVTLVGTDNVQTLSNKTLDNTNIITVQDNNFTLQDNGDNTKQAQFQLSGLTTATTRIYTLPDVNDTLVALVATQTLENKTIDGTTATGNNTVLTDADDVSYDNVNSGLTATNVQDALDEIADEFVVGPASSTDNAIVRYDGTTGKLIQDSGVIIDDLDAVSGITELDVDNININGNTISSSDVNGNIIISPNGNGIIEATSNIVIQDENELRFEDNAGTNYIGFKAPTSVTTSTTFTLPDEDSTGNQALFSDGAGTLYFDSVLLAATGDINETTVSLNNNETTPVNVTGLAFSNADVRSANITYSIVVDATNDLYEEGTMKIVQRGSDWTIARQYSGDFSQVDFNINSSGQITYTTPNYAGFVSAQINYRAIVTNI